MNSFLRSGAITFLLCHPFFLGVGSVRGRSSTPEQLGQGTLSEAMSGILPNASAVSALDAAQQCVELPVLPPNDRLQGPHGTTLISTKCEVLAYHAVAGVPAGGWTTARYRWTSVFTAEDSARGPAARDTATEEEAVLFDSPQRGKLRPVWHARFDSGEYGVYRSITPEVASTTQRSILLSVAYCVNGTGGCSQEFLQRRADGRWSTVRQSWLDQLPAGFSQRILHGVRIEPRTLKGEAGFYGSSDPNCCPSQVLRIDLALRGNSLVLIHQTIVSTP
jgi:hypothetical protein